MEVKIYQVDAFTSKPFSGNPAAVCILEEPRESVFWKNRGTRLGCWILLKR
jgi:predicted PhzF superfamily epimerase YddE/YHI9